jgi:hypothetical protein
MESIRTIPFGARARGDAFPANAFPHFLDGVSGRSRARFASPSAVDEQVDAHLVTGF